MIGNQNKRKSIVELLRSQMNQSTAILACNFYNYETLKGVLLAAKALECPVMLQLTRSSIDYMGLKVAASMARNLSELLGVDSYLHLDHGDSIDLVHACLDEGFDSVMIDGSEKEFAKNVKITRTVVELAKPYGVGVEAELGYIAKLGQESAEGDGFTTPESALQFVKETGVDLLAIAIGSAHGFYKSTPNLRIDLLKSIHSALDIPLVLHGSSGIPDDQIRQAVSNGICKVNIATEVKNIFMKTLKATLIENDDIDLRKVFPFATDSVKLLLEKKLKVVSIS